MPPRSKRPADATLAEGDPKRQLLRAESTLSTQSEGDTGRQQRADPTLHQLLSQKPPKLVLTNQSLGSSSINTGWARIASSNITPWDDFTLLNIVDAFKGLLDRQGVDVDVADSQLTDHERQMVNETSVHDHFSKWDKEMLKKPLNRLLTEQMHNLDLEMVTVPQIDFAHERGAYYNGKYFTPDWAIKLSGDRRENLVAGESKPSSKWASKRSSDRDKWLGPFRQILTYCLALETRYGFLHTPEELVAVRVCTELDNTHTLKYQSVPTRNHGIDKLTVHLSLWALSMFALNPNHRKISTKEQTLPLNFWWKDDAKFIFQHHLTTQEVSELPQGAIWGSRATGRLDMTNVKAVSSTRGERKGKGRRK